MPYHTAPYHIKSLVDGKWSAWTQWSACSATCGGGSRTRGRFCDPPQNGGAPCTPTSGTRGSVKMESQKCNEQTCPCKQLAVLLCFYLTLQLYSFHGCFKHTLD